MRIQPSVSDQTNLDKMRIDSGAGLVATPTDDDLPRRYSDFDTMPAALAYAAQGLRGLNFHDARGKLVRPYPFSELREDALEVAYRLIARGHRPGDRVALIAETAPEFVALFFGALYARVWPVPLPLPTSFGGRDAYIEQLSVQLKSADPSLLLYPAELAGLAGAAADAVGVAGQDWESFIEDRAEAVELAKPSRDDIAYLEFGNAIHGQMAV